VNQPRPTFRFAPSPTGELHIGHALSALTGWRWAKRLGGRFLLRIEDIDTGRARPHFIEQIYDDLTWLGLDWEQPVLRQSEHFELYQSAAHRLHQMDLLYPCFATRKEIAAAASQTANSATDPDGAPLYPGLHKDLDAIDIAQRTDSGEPFALRLDMVQAITKANAIIGGNPLAYTALDDDGQSRQVIAQPARWGDAVIIRKDVPASYHLAVVVDDAHQGITHVTRGTDLEPATDLHCLLQTLLGVPTPQYHHHRLILDSDGSKFSKSKGAPSLRSLRQQGLSRNAVIELLNPANSPSSDDLPDA